MVAPHSITWLVLPTPTSPTKRWAAQLKLHCPHSSCTPLYCPPGSTSRGHPGPHHGQRNLNIFWSSLSTTSSWWPTSLVTRLDYSLALLICPGRSHLAQPSFHVLYQVLDEPDQLAGWKSWLMQLNRISLQRFLDGLACSWEILTERDFNVRSGSLALYLLLLSS